MSVRLVPGLDPATYRRHSLHGETRAWPETNCYVDLWIETLHGLGLDPVAGLAFTASIDLEGDQFTFFKYPIADLEALYGVEIIELNVWRKLPEQIVDQVALGRVVIVELDSFFLPDTAGNTYRTAHVKSSVAVELYDLPGQRMHYFHNAGYYALEGEDFAGAFRLGGDASAAHLPPYVEVAKLGRREPLRGDALTRAAREQLRFHLGRRPRQNPFFAYRSKFERDLAWLQGADLESFHAYAFATLRMFGANFELLGAYCRWLAERGGAPALLEAAVDFETISSTAKTMQFKLARAVQGKRAVEFGPMLDGLEAAWIRGQARLDAAAAAPA
jgi:hypothetical protein